MRYNIYSSVKKQILAIVIVIIMIVFILDYVELKEKYRTTQQYNISNRVLESKLLKNTFELQKKSWFLSINGIDEDIKLKNENNVDFKLNDKLIGISLLMLFDSNMCSSCLDREILNLRNIRSTYKNLNLIIVARGFGSNYLFNDTKYDSLSPYIFTSTSSPFKNAFKTESPLYALLNNTQTLFVYQTDKNHNQAYYNLIEVLNSLNKK